ncbi:MAG: energy transducer TonB [Rhodospirillaceae bacterium]|nr:energy transducer TonB [Rhodospirillaceae bacterium]
MELSSVPRYIPPPPNHRRLLVLAAVVALQVFIVALVQSGLAKMMVDRINGPMETRLIEELKEIKEAPPPPPPAFKAPPPVFVASDLVIAEAPTEAAITSTARPQAAAPPVVKDVINPPRGNPRRPNTGADEIYPTMSKRLGEAGSVILLLTVNEEGRVTAADIKETSGFQRLDEAAQKEAVRSWRFLAGTINGKPTAMQMQLKVTFKISK